mmetsp:Transcript_35890/g.55205  ORF Transcript_35890/g.55205 Transcript_35890/m.55205 type:complete len:251 (+) Transcript_35890:3-755(+)
MPGDELTSLIDVKGSPDGTQSLPKLGHGLSYHPDQNRTTANLGGQFIYTNSTNAYYVRTNSSRYIPILEDRVVGVIQDRVHVGDVLHYRVHVGAPHTVLLSSVAFQGATKRNKPNLALGSLVYARVIRQDEPCQLSCIAGARDPLPHKDWMTKESIYGELQGGTVRKISIGLARSLLDPQNAVLEELGSSLSFEVCIGVNGMVWVNSKNVEHTIVILNAIVNSEVLTEAQTRGMVRSLIKNTNSQSNSAS